MKILVFGSYNIDKVYTMPRLPETGEDIYCTNYEVHVGGKGLNQALALARAGADVCVAGKVGSDGNYLTDYLKNNGIDVSDIDFSGDYTGHTIIQVDPDGQNQMILFGGANQQITEDYCDKILEKHSDADLILTEYETSCVEYILKKAHGYGIRTAINPSPFVEKCRELPFDCIDCLILNEYEGRSITGKYEYGDVIRALHELIGGEVILTLGSEGAMYFSGKEIYSSPAYKVNAVDTTGAGDTFTGYCLFSLLKGESPDIALKTGCAASAIEVTKPGAAETIPYKEEVADFLKNNQ